MKKQLILPILAVVLAVGGAFASNRLATGYYELGAACTGSYSVEPHCTLGEDEICTENGQTYFQKANPEAPTSPSNPCEEVIRQAQ